MAETEEVRPGRRISWTRTITEEAILAFAELSGDKGRHHLETDEKGRLMAHGLLTATLPTKLGGDLDYVARDMVFHFLRPVYAGDVLTCDGIVEKVEEKPRRLVCSFAFSIRNQEGKEVLKGTTSGYILK